ncbi:hypothetical protein BCR44DRAFT_28394 [Catenaria anguillulae PL171]|uniref:G-protein coupled receptors family 3 profile domain-containing protein n=1 Tax=Catenaria anguillulae PL171 TaxID=765915 RepID=A0A1Y2GYF0_9FUNG|nr:hypothetical protein BCR44DRAFT_28394 [Catenaria anguillulae PL171]
MHYVHSSSSSSTATSTFPPTPSSIMSFAMDDRDSPISMLPVEIILDILSLCDASSRLPATSRVTAAEFFRVGAQPHRVWSHRLVFHNPQCDPQLVRASASLDANRGLEMNAWARQVAQIQSHFANYLKLHVPAAEGRFGFAGGMAPPALGGDPGNVVERAGKQGSKTMVTAEFVEWLFRHPQAVVAGMDLVLKLIRIREKSLTEMFPTPEEVGESDGTGTMHVPSAPPPASSTGVASSTAPKRQLLPDALLLVHFFIRTTQLDLLQLTLTRLHTRFPSLATIRLPFSMWSHFMLDNRADLRFRLLSFVQSHHDPDMTYPAFLCFLALLEWSKPTLDVISQVFAQSLDLTAFANLVASQYDQDMFSCMTVNLALLTSPPFTSACVLDILNWFPQHGATVNLDRFPVISAHIRFSYPIFANVLIQYDIRNLGKASAHIRAGLGAMVVKSVIEGHTDLVPVALEHELFSDQLLGQVLREAVLKGNEALVAVLASHCRGNLSLMQAMAVHALNMNEHAEPDPPAAYSALFNMLHTHAIDPNAFLVTYSNHVPPCALSVILFDSPSHGLIFSWNYVDHLHHWFEQAKSLSKVDSAWAVFMSRFIDGYFDSWMRGEQVRVDVVTLACAIRLIGFQFMRGVVGDLDRSSEAEYEQDVDRVTALVARTIEMLRLAQDVEVAAQDSTVTFSLVIPSVFKIMLHQCLTAAATMLTPIPIESLDADVLARSANARSFFLDTLLDLDRSFVLNSIPFGTASTVYVWPRFQEHELESRLSVDTVLGIIRRMAKGKNAQVVSEIFKHLPSSIRDSESFLFGVRELRMSQPPDCWHAMKLGLESAQHRHFPWRHRISFDGSQAVWWSENSQTKPGSHVPPTHSHESIFMSKMHPIIRLKFPPHGSTWFVGLALVGLMALTILPTTVNGVEIRLAASLPFSATDVTDSHVATAIQKYLELSIADVNAEIAGPAGHSVSIKFLDSAAKRANATANVHIAAKEHNAIAVIGDKGSGTTIPMVLNAKALNMHVCSGSATSSKLTDDQFRDTFLRTIAPDEDQVKGLAYYLKYMNWKACVILASTSNYGRSVTFNFIKEAQKLGITIVTTQLVNISDRSPNRTQTLQRAVNAVAETGIRIIMFFGVEAEFLSIAELATTAGIIDDNHVWVASEGVSDFRTMAKSNATIQQWTNGMQWIFPNELIDKQRIKRLVDGAKASLGQDEFEGYGGFYVDCLYALTHMYVNMLNNGIVSADDLTGRRVRKSISDVFVPFKGISGDLELDNNGTRKSSSFSIYSLYKDKTTECFTISNEGTVTELVAPLFYSGKAARVPDRPESAIGFLRFTDVAGWIVLAITGIMAVAIVITTAMILRQWRHPVVKAYHPFGLVMTSLGLLLYLGAIVSWFNEQTVLSCHVGLWATSIGLEVVVLALIMRTYNTWYSSENPIIRRSASHSTSILQVILFLILFIVEFGILTLWTIYAPIEPQPVATITSFSFQCTSVNLATFNAIKWAHNVWLAILLSVLLYLTSTTRFLRTPGHSSRYGHFVAVNYFLCGAIVAVFTSLPLPSFALGTFYIETALVWYSAGFTFAMTHWRILKQLGKPNDRPHHDPHRQNMDSDVSASLSRPMAHGGGVAGPALPTWTPTGNVPPLSPARNRPTWVISPFGSRLRFPFGSSTA